MVPCDWDAGGWGARSSASANVNVAVSSGYAMAKGRWPSLTVRYLFASVGGQFVGGGLSGVCGPAQEVGEQVEFGVAVSGADLVQ
jgi:hypothetical protein